MNILALDFSSPERSVALVSYQGTAEQVLAELSDRDFRSNTGPALVGRILEAAQLTPQDLDLVAVGIGPGSYTGIRSSIAIAQGLQLALGKKIVGISSVEILVAEAQTKQMSGKLQVILDAQRNELYSAVYDLPSGKLLDPLALIPINALIAQTGVQIAGPEATRFAETAVTLHPQALTLARIARERSNFVPGEQLEPIYLRPISFVKAPPLRQLP